MQVFPVQVLAGVTDPIITSVMGIWSPYWFVRAWPAIIWTFIGAFDVYVHVVVPICSFIAPGVMAVPLLMFALGSVRERYMFMSSVPVLVVVPAPDLLVSSASKFQWLGADTSVYNANGESVAPNVHVPEVGPAPLQVGLLLSVGTR